MVKDEAKHVWSGGQRSRVHSRGLGEAHLLGQVDRLERAKMRQWGKVTAAAVRTMHGDRQHDHVRRRHGWSWLRRTRSDLWKPTFIL